MKPVWLRGMVLYCVVVAVAATSHAAPADTAKLEPWADQSLPVSQGLVLWLDAARQPAAWQAHGKPELVSGNDLDVWYDGSGHGRDFTQAVRGAQPKFVAGAKDAALRFDGENDYLRWGAAPQKLDRFTLVLVAAPRSNVGGFRAFFSGAETGKNDYVTGLNVDLGPFGSDRFDVLNVEGAGFGGFRNLIKTPVPFRQLHTVMVTGDTNPARITAWLDGTPEGGRERAADARAVRADHLFLGARYYSNDPAPPFVSGFLDGDVAEVLLYDRVLAPDELVALHAYISHKHASYANDVARTLADAERLHPVENPPDVQMFVPGFTVRPLPLDLTNVNNVRYRDDGKLIALAYDGNVYVLSDTDADGLEDKADLFWDNQGRLTSPIGMALTPPGYAKGRGVFVASKGKVSLLLDADGDGRAEKETIVADGWTPLPHQVDAMGVALGADGSVYFGLGATNFTSPYLTDPAGRAHYRLGDDHGTIQRVAPDFSRREIVCTGIRFPVGLAFNPAGDLFATDQEGATWLPNGNPFDELLHIQSGRHYGFPPRHPKHLPDVIDEPSVFDYAPQHQSGCGLLFNEPVNGGPVFGPAWWRGDALVCGESRGKLFRTQLVKTPAGYVARNQIIASLTHLTIDACVSPRGDLIVATHSGNPDWGSGPKGKGRLYQLRYTGHDEPQPVACWAAGPHEVRVAFDRPLDPARLAELSSKASIDFGASVGAGDHFEKIRPGYAVVQRQMNEPRHKLAVNGVQVTGDRRTLVLATARQTEAVRYALTLPGLNASAAEKTGEVTQVNAIDLAYDLTGATAEWKPDSPQDRTWSGWLPHLDLAVARAFTAQSADHGRLWQSLKTPGRLTLRTSLDPWNTLRPAVQPGSRLDYTLPPERVTVTIESNVPLEVRTASNTARAESAPDGTNRAILTFDPKESEPVALQIVVATGEREPTLTIYFTTAEDSRPRALPLRRFLLPWATLKREAGSAADVAQAEIPQLKGGRWLKGREVFFGEQAGCAKCHRVNGQGGDLGPDLSNLVHRDYDSVLRDVREPSGSLNPDYIASTVRLKDGRVLNGILRSVKGNRFVVRDVEGEKSPFHKDQIDRITASPVSVMPEGLEQGLGPDRMRDLMTFLLTQPLEPAPSERDGAPPARTRAELDAVLKAAADADRRADASPLRVMLSAGPKDHGPGEHDYPRWQDRWAKLLAMSEGVQVETCQGFPSADQLKAADVVVFYSDNPGWSKDKGADLDAFLARGGGLVYIHYAVDGHDAAPELAERIGLAWRAGSRFRHGHLDLAFADRDHPITRGFDKLALEDESYWNLTGDAAGIHALAAAAEEGQDRPLVWVRERGKGRVFVSIPGHYTWTFDDPLFRMLLLRGIAWAAGRPAERLTHLAAIGARLQD